jgi:O-methyltransferase involved in polyketide biosynthesis
VIEVAAGLSPRGWRFTERYGERLTYIEGDLAGMAARKRRALEQMGSLDGRHRVVVLDALRDDGPESLAAITDELDLGGGLAIVTEGLLGYLPWDAVAGIWRRFAAALERFETGRYISEIHLASVADLQVRAFRVLLSAFVRGRVYLHFDTPAEVMDALRAAGFASAAVRPAADIAGAGHSFGARLAHILEASTS